MAVDALFEDLCLAACEGERFAVSRNCIQNLIEYAKVRVCMCVFNRGSEVCLRTRLLLYGERSMCGSTGMKAKFN